MLFRSPLPLPPPPFIGQAPLIADRPCCCCLVLSLSALLLALSEAHYGRHARGKVVFAARQSGGLGGGTRKLAISAGDLRV